MHYSVGVEYALHCLLYLIRPPQEGSLGIKEIAAFQGISETYLSKIFAKLAKAGIIDSVPGVKGGYKLARDPETISFWDVLEAVEGNDPIFSCKNIKERGMLYRQGEVPACVRKEPCTINMVMLEAEERMREYLRSKTLAWLDHEVSRVLPRELREKTQAYFSTSISHHDA